MEDELGIDDEFLNLVSNLCDNESCRLSKPTGFNADTCIAPVSVPESELANSEEGDFRDSSPLNFRRHKRQRQNDDEARIIAAETEIHLKKMNLDPESKEGKIEKRKIQNRMSAQLHRERKRAYIETLEEEVRVRDALITKLRQRVLILEESLGIKTDRRIGANGSSDSQSGASVLTTSDSDSDDSTIELRGENGKRHPFGVSLFSLLLFLTFSFNFLRQPDRYLFSVAEIDDKANEAVWQSRVLLEAPPIVQISADVDNFQKLKMQISQQPNAKPDGIFSIGGISNPSHIDFKDECVGKCNFPPNNVSLWRYDKPVARLYPPCFSDCGIAFDIKGFVRDEGKSDDTSFDKTNFGSLRGSLRNADRALIPAVSYSSSGRQGSKVEQDRSIPYRADYAVSDTWEWSSKAMVSSGKALLDPSVFFTAISAKDTFPKRRIIVQEEASRELKSSKALIPVSRSSEEYIPTSFVETNRIISPKLLMMLPLSAIKWGKTWEDVNSEDPMEKLLLKLKRNVTIGSVDNIWIEIGCNIVTAQLVSNVSFS